MFKYEGVLFNVSVFRTETGSELYSCQIRGSSGETHKFNLGTRDDITDDPHLPIVMKLMAATNIEVETAKQSGNCISTYLTFKFLLRWYELRTRIPDDNSKWQKEEKTY